MLSAGTYKVEKILSCFIGESPEKKTPFFSIEFQLENGESIDWIAWLSDRDEKAIAAANRNVETLKKLGFKKTDIAEMANEKNSISDLFGAPEDTINLVIEIESFEKKGGGHGERPRIKYVNVGEGNFSNLSKFDHKTAVVKFKSLPFNGTLKKLLAGEKLPPPPKSDKKDDYQAPADGGAFHADDIPF